LSNPDTLRRYAIFGVVLLLHLAVFLALSDLIIFKAPVVADAFDRVQLAKTVEPLPPPPPPIETQPSLPPPSVDVTPSTPAVMAQVVPAFNPAITMPQIDATRLPPPNLAIPSPNPGAGPPGTVDHGVTGDSSQLNNALKGGKPNDTLGVVSFSQATWDTVSAVQKIEDGYPNVAWTVARRTTVDDAALKRNPVTHNVIISDNPQLICPGDPTEATLRGVLNSFQQSHPKNLVLILDLTDRSDRNLPVAKAAVNKLRDLGIRLFIIPMTRDGAETAIDGSVYQCLCSYVTESGGVVYFPAGIPQNYDNIMNQQQ